MLVAARSVRRGHSAWRDLPPDSGMPCCATTRSSGTCASCSNSSAPRFASTSSKAITKRRRFHASSDRWFINAPRVEPDKRPFGTQLDVHHDGYEWINHSLQPTQSCLGHDFRITDRAENCAQPYSASVFNISAMSFGALSRQCHPGAERRRQARRLHARHRRGLDQHSTTGCTAATWSGRSARAISAAAATMAASTRPRSSWPMPPTRRSSSSRSSCHRAPSPATAACCRAPKVTPEIAAGARRTGGRGLRVTGGAQRLLAPRCELLAVRRSGCVSSPAASPLGFKLCIGHPWEWFAHLQGHARQRHHARFHRGGRRRKAAPAPHRLNSPTTSARRCRKACCWCTTRWWA